MLVHRSGPVRALVQETWKQAAALANAHTSCSKHFQNGDDVRRAARRGVLTGVHRHREGLVEGTHQAQGSHRAVHLEQLGADVALWNAEVGDLPGGRGGPGLVVAVGTRAARHGPGSKLYSGSLLKPNAEVHFSATAGLQSTAGRVMTNA